jgi:hypothetical protein
MGSIEVTQLHVRKMVMTTSVAGISDWGRGASSSVEFEHRKTPRKRRKLKVFGGKSVWVQQLALSYQSRNPRSLQTPGTELQDPSHVPKQMGKAYQPRLLSRNGSVCRKGCVKGPGGN